jgi:hypothetical protein
MLQTVVTAILFMASSVLAHVNWNARRLGPEPGNWDAGRRGTFFGASDYELRPPQLCLVRTSHAWEPTL